MMNIAITLREATAMLKEKSFTLILLLEVLLVSSSGLLSIGYVMLTSPEASNTLSQLSNLVYVGVVTDTRDPYSQVLDEGRMNYRFYSDFQLARTDMDNGIIDAILLGDIALRGNLSSDMKPAVVTVFLPDNSPKTPLTKLALKRVLVSLEGKLRQTKVELYYPKLDFMSYKIMKYNPRSRYIEIYFIFTLPILLFLPCVVSGSLAIDTITQDLESKRIINLLVAPLTNAQIVFGKVMASFLLSLSQSVLWLLVLSLTFVKPENHFWLILLCSLYTMVFTNAGTILALCLKKMKSSQILYTFVTMAAISLFSPFANLYPLLLNFSPSYIITRLALGTPVTVFLWQ
ncbi:MAG: ABC transporter permease, partial [Candidatus Altiarchaeota archaeon]